MDWKQVVELTAIIIAAWAVWLSLPRSPSLDWQRLFKVTISVGLWAEIEASQDHQGASEGVESEWRRLLSECLPFHPAGRSWREKVVNPVEYIPPVPALPGERGLLEALAALETKQERWDRLFGARAHEVDVAVADALGDPRELGAEYDPRRLLGPEADWAGVAAWSEPVRSGLTRRLQHVILLEIGLAEGLSPGAEVPDVRRHVAPGVGDGPDGGWEALCEAPSDRFVVVLHGALLRPWLTCMTQSPALVDRIVGVVVAGGAPAHTEAERTALEALLLSESLLPELQRRTPVAVLDDVDRQSPWASGMAPIDLPDLQASRLGVRWIDLGPLPIESVSPKPLARALVVTIGFLLDS